MARLQLLTVACFAAFTATVVEGGTITVDVLGGADFRDLQPAIDAAHDGDTVVVKPGEYLVGTPLTFRGRAITVRAEAGPDRTAIRRSEPPAAQEDAMVVVFRDGETGSSVLAGFTVAGHVTDMGGVPGGTYAVAGGGILCAGGTRPTLRDCVIAGCAAELGGGIACEEGSSPQVYRSTVAWNFAFNGGGVYLEGGSALFEECTITGNIAHLPDAGGGGVACIGPGTARFARCRITGNSAACGAAVHVDDSSPIFENCTIFGHGFSALEAGCGICSEPMFINCTVAGNEWDALGCHGFRSALFLNCILASNWRQGWNPWEDGSYNLSGSDPRFVNEGVVDLTRWGVVELAGRDIRVPQFVVEEPDLHLQPDSPAIDAGAAAGAPGADIEGNPRPSCRGVDLGAYEFTDCAALPARFRRGDCNEDGTADISDGVCILNWLFLEGDRPGCLAVTNSNADESTDISDATYLLNHLFLGGPPPAAPFPGCGTSQLPADEALGCEAPSC